MADAETLRVQQGEDHLNLLIDDIDDDQGRKHFDMKKIIKTAAARGKKSKKAEISESGAKISKSGAKISESGEKISEIGDDFDVDEGDPRFAALYESALFSIEPSDPMFKRTKGMEKLIDEKLKRKRKSDGKPTTNRPIGPVGAPDEKSTFTDNQLNSLVESIKRRAKQGDITKLNKKHKISKFI